jgi:hypothetical protein
MIGELYDLVMQHARRLQKKQEVTKLIDDTSFTDRYIALIGDVLGKLAEEEARKWNPELRPAGILYTTIIEKAMKLPEKMITGDGTTFIIAKNHYLIEACRIPLKEPPTLLNILRIAFAHGQLLSQLRQTDFPEGLIKSYKLLELYKLVNYVEEEDWVVDIPEDLLDELKASLLKAH